MKIDPAWWVSCSEYDLGPFRSQERAEKKLVESENLIWKCRNEHAVVYGRVNPDTGRVVEEQS
jgi:hypothetical protein